MKPDKYQIAHLVFGIYLYRINDSWTSQLIWWISKQYCICQTTLFLSSSLSFHRLTGLENVFHGTQEKVCSSLHVHKHINNYLTSSKCLSNYWLCFSADNEVKWRGDGCETVNINERETECHCNHLTYFAILVVSSRFTKKIRLNKCVLLIAGNILHWEPDLMNERYFSYPYEFA